MDFNKIIEENYNKYILPYENTEKEINEIETYFIVCNGKEKELLKLYEYQQNFLLSLNNYKYTMVKKDRQTGYTSLYAAHICYELHKQKEQYEKTKDMCIPPYKKFYIVASTFREAADIKNKAKCFASEKYGEYFAFVIESNVFVCNENNVKNIMMGRSDSQEVFFENASFIKNLEKALYDIAQFTSKVIICGEDKENCDFEKIWEGVSGADCNKIETKWYEVPAFNKHLCWYKIEKEKTIDSEGNISYNKEEWDKKIVEGWTPTSPWKTNYDRAMGKENKLIN